MLAREATPVLVLILALRQSNSSRPVAPTVIPATHNVHNIKAPTTDTKAENNVSTRVVQTDVTDLSQIDTAVEATVETFRLLNIAAANAAWASAVSSSRYDLSDDDGRQPDGSLYPIPRSPSSVRTTGRLCLFPVSLGSIPFRWTQCTRRRSDGSGASSPVSRASSSR